MHNWGTNKLTMKLESRMVMISTAPTNYLRISKLSGKMGKNALVKLEIIWNHIPMHTLALNGIHDHASTELRLR